MRKQIITIIALFFITMFSGCSSKVSHDDAIGNYEVRYPYGTEKLQLHKDGTYAQTVLIDGEASAKSNKGRWEFREKESEVVLFDAMIVDDFFGHLKPSYWKIEPGLSTFPAKKSFGKVTLLINSDQGFAYKKIRE